MYRCFWTFLVMAVAGGCAGVDESPPAAFQDRMAVLTEDGLRVDGYAADLVPVGSLAVSDDGRIAVTQFQDSRVRVFGPAGEDLGGFGGAGEGPGEFERVNRVGWLADTLWVYDSALRRITLISPELELARTVSNISGAARPPPGEAGDVPEFPFVYPRHLWADGSLTVTLGISVRQEVPERFRGTPIARMTPDGTLERILAVAPPQEGGSVRAGGSVAGVPFGNAPRLDLSPDGELVAVAMASLDGPNAGTFEVVAVRAEGDTVFSQRYPFEGEPIDPAEGDSAIAAAISRLENMGMSDLAQIARREVRPPPVHPPLLGLVVGGDGSIWIQQRSREERRLYYVVAPEGDPVGALLLPERTTLGAASLGRIWVVERDEVDMPSVARYRVGWP